MSPLKGIQGNIQGENIMVISLPKMLNKNSDEFGVYIPDMLLLYYRPLNDNIFEDT